ncbi:MAG: carbon-nitrogen hydrolase family protein [Chloroflexi bacterium]|nr:carbon-nitrogen hydrolase family protein [Chloroflexota bacterium]
MPRRIRVATTSLATLEDVKPPYNLRNPTPQENLERGLAMLEGAGAQGVDLAVLPESLLSAGLPYEHAAINAAAQTIPGPAFDAIADCARRHNMYVVTGLPMRDGELLRNVAVLIDRKGELVGIYAKRHPTEGEIGSGIVPGDAAAVFETDFGRVGLAICFDLNWADLWATMAAQGADLICWLSAYPGGFPLAMYAWQHRYRVVSSVWTYEARVIDITGRTVAETSRWGRIAVCDLDLDKRLFHTDGQMQHILPIQTRYGQRVTVETLGEEHLFTLSSNDAALNVDDIIAEFGLVEYIDYVARCTIAQTSTRVPIGSTNQ